MSELLQVAAGLIWLGLLALFVNVLRKEQNASRVLTAGVFAFFAFSGVSVVLRSEDANHLLLIGIMSQLTLILFSLEKRND